MINPDIPVFRAALDRLLRIGLILTAAATVAALFAEQSWFLELFAHFPLQTLCVAAVFGAVLAWRGERRMGMLAGLVVVVNLIVLLAPGSVGRPALASAPEGRRLSLLLTNVERVNALRDPIIAYVAATRPDIVAVLEIDQAWRRDLDARLLAYPHRLIRTLENNFGIGVYSRVPLIDAEVLDLSGVGLPSLLFRVMLDGQPVRVLVTHPVPPVGKAGAGIRDRQLDAIAGVAKEGAQPVIVVGDLNLTPWSPRFRSLLRVGGLTDSRRGFGHQATWPVWFPLLSIPIDHVLVGPGLKVYRREVGPAVGSDHYPVLVEVGI